MFMFIRHVTPVIPPSQLRAPAEFCYRSDSSDEDDDVSLIQLSKRWCVTAKEFCSFEESQSTLKLNEDTIV